MKPITYLFNEQIRFIHNTYEKTTMDSFFHYYTAQILSLRYEALVIDTLESQGFTISECFEYTWGKPHTRLVRFRF